MKLLRITGQSKDLRQFYESSEWGEAWQDRIGAMFALVKYMEDAVDYPAQWVVTSHDALVFKKGDDYLSPSLASVRPCIGELELPRWAIYQIQYPAEPPWSAVIGYAGDIETAGQMVVDALSRFPEPLQKDKSQG